VSSGYLYDSVTLQHFAVANSLDLLRSVHASAGEPRWTEQVRREVQNGTNRLLSDAHCRAVLDFTWLAEPVSGDAVETLRLRAVLGDGTDSDDHLGEAESIVVARSLRAIFVTDDGPAYDFAAHRSNLGPSYVQDACTILWTAASMRLIDEPGIERFHHAVFDAQRTMRCRCRFWPGGKSLDDQMRTLRWR